MPSIIVIHLRIRSTPPVAYIITQCLCSNIHTLYKTVKALTCDPYICNYNFGSINTLTMKNKNSYPFSNPKMG
jgi:hypothetical protein